jgi:hypothetical protein
LVLTELTLTHTAWWWPASARARGEKPEQIDQLQLQVKLLLLTVSRFSFETEQHYFFFGFLHAGLFRPVRPTVSAQQADQDDVRAHYSNVSWVSGGLARATLYGLWAVRNLSASLQRRDCHFRGSQRRGLVVFVCRSKGGFVLFTN